MNLQNFITLDIETYKNYILIMFVECDSLNSHFIVYDESQGSIKKLKRLIRKIKDKTWVTFNGNNFDLPILKCILAGKSKKDIHDIATDIIENSLRYWEISKKYNTNINLKINHIDLIEVAPLFESLKGYGARLHCKKLQELPVKPDKELTFTEQLTINNYCYNDNLVTVELFKHLYDELKLRKKLTKQYNIDLMSKSDAQIAEAVIRKELGIEGRIKTQIPNKFKYDKPDYINFKTEHIKKQLDFIDKIEFNCKSSGHVILPDELKKFKLNLGNSKYTIKMGGIHSCEKQRLIKPSEDEILIDYDVASYYPATIINNKFYPHHLGGQFLVIYNNLIERRLKAKKEGNKIISDSLKITLNGTFGKFAERYSIMYDPKLMIQTTLTGQLSLVLLIEALEMGGINVISANTDGIVIHTNKKNKHKINTIIKEWENITNYTLEANEYSLLASKDVNNYIAITKEGKFKTKGLYANQYDHYNKLRKNPTNFICVESVMQFLLDNVSIESTIKSCKDFTKFITSRRVNGGAIKNDKEIGKVIRWYYQKNELDAIYYANNGNKVPKSDEAIPIMNLPETFLDDIDYDWYINEANSILSAIGYFN